MALDALDAGMRRILVGAVFRSHDGVAGKSAKGGGIHIRNAAVGSKTEDHDIQDRGTENEEEAVANQRRLEVDFRVNGGQLAGVAQFSAAEKNSDGNENEPEDKHTRQDEEEEDADVGGRRAREDEVINPETREGDGAGASEHDADQAEGVLAEVIEESCPIFDGVLRSHGSVASLEISVQQ